MALVFDGHDQGGESNINAVNGMDENSPKSSKVKKEIEEKFGFSVQQLYKMAISFYREKENKAFHVSYENRSKLAAYTKQVKHGKFDDTKKQNANGDVGFFDLVGNDRRHAWEELGDLSREDAMAGFVSLLDSVCPQFRVYLEAQKRDADEKNRLESLDKEKREALTQERQKYIEEEFRLRADGQKQQIQEALNRQTYHQFRAYAEQQCPGNLEQQLLIAQLQEQHYQQYMAQIYSQQVMYEQQQMADGKAVGEQELLNRGAEDAHNNRKDAEGHQGSEGDGSESTEEKEELPSNPAIAPASMWTRKDIKEFKETIRKEGSEGIIKVGHGETVTVRVPTHEDGSCLFWEFATDHYDIGFGIYFEWTISETNTVSVHISESDEEDDDELEEKKEDVEGGVGKDKNAGKPQTDEIIPVYRRDCHEEVYAGSHVYPGRGVYLLKFDNSYSLWRSKTLFYRVYYSK